MTPSSDIRAAWLAQLLSTQPADRPRAESAVRALYTAAGFNEPDHILWFDSPFAASWIVAVLLAPHDHQWAQTLSSASLSRGDRASAERAKSSLSERLGIADWNAVSKTIGAPLGAMRFPPDPERMFQPKLFDARYGLSDDISEMIMRHSMPDELQQVEQRFWGGNLGALVSALHCPTTESLIGRSFFEEYSFSAMAHDEAMAGAEPPPIMRAAWEVARSSGMWWPFANAAIMSDRPTELHVNEAKLLHRGDGPAVIFRDGWQVYAWNGKAVPERWILHPETVPPREYKGFDPTFSKYIASRLEGAVKGARPAKPAKPSAILKAKLSTDPLARIDQLRTHAGGKLPLLDRYQAGDHRQIWQELISLAGQVRADPHAADALAVACETMRRVESNVRTLVQRLTAMNYRFKSRPHVAPDSSIVASLAEFERTTAVLPLSLRTFYEIVGGVNLMGSHPTLAPRRGDIAPDPFVVYEFDEGAVEFDEDDEEGETPSAITIAPDDLHKADTSGGDPYEMAIPDDRADGELLNERHELFFVDYLRLCFRFGGFPGYDGLDHVAKEIAALREGLLEF